MRGKRVAPLALTLGLVALLALGTLAGCGEGKADGEGDGGKTPGSEGTLGIPIYPGASLVPGSTDVGAGEDWLDNVTWKGATYTTPDSKDKVIAWYSKELGKEPMLSDEDGWATWVWEGKDREWGAVSRMVSVSVCEGVTTISTDVFRGEW